MNNTTLTDLSSALADAVAAVAPSLLSVRSRRGTTGIAWSEDGLILTTAQGLRRDSVGVRLPDGSTHEARVLGRDPGTHLALLKVDATLTPAPRGSTSALRAGNIVLAVGQRRGSAGAAFGILSRVGGAWTSRSGGSIDRYLDVDGSLPPGFPGGPLVGADGTVVGLNVRALVPGGTTIPVETLERVAAQLLEHGKPVTAYIGVGVQSVDLPELERSGLVVTAVEEGPAREAGLLVGDVLLNADETSLERVRDLMAFVARTAPGTVVPLHILRAGKPATVDITTGAR